MMALSGRAALRMREATVGSGTISVVGWRSMWMPDSAARASYSAASFSETPEKRAGSALAFRVWGDITVKKDIMRDLTVSTSVALALCQFRDDGGYGSAVLAGTHIGFAGDGAFAQLWLFVLVP